MTSRSLKNTVTFENFEYFCLFIGLTAIRAHSVEEWGPEVSLVYIPTDELNETVIIYNSFFRLLALTCTLKSFI